MNNCRRLISIGIGALLSISTFLTVIPQAEITVYADGDKTISGLCTGAIGNPTPGDTAGLTGWMGSYVYYGKYGTNAMKYRVLDIAATQYNTNTTMLLDCNNTIEDKQFDSSSNVWANSGIRTWLNGNDFYGNENVFKGQEKAAIAVSAKNGASGTDGQGWSGTLGFAKLENNEKIFLLDAVEATNTSYGYANTDGPGDTRKKSGTTLRWWLRSPDSIDASHAGEVFETGNLYSVPVSSARMPGVSPAFNLNLQSVIFSSLIPNKTNEYKLTVKDTKMTIAKTDGFDVTRAGNVVTVPYTITGENAGNATQVSVLIIPNDEYSPGTVSTTGYWYQKLNVTTRGTSGMGTFTLPDAYADETCGTDYYAYILAEDVNGTYETDYASEPASITIPDAPITVTFDPNGDGATVSPTTTTTKTDGTLELYPEPVWNGHTFIGWYTAATGGTLVTTNTTFSSNDTIYAHWIKCENASIDAPDSMVKGQVYSITTTWTFAKEITQDEKEYVNKRIQFSYSPDNFTSRKITDGFNGSSYSRTDEITVPADTTASNLVWTVKFDGEEKATKTIPITDTEPTNHTVTYKVKNGKWNDGSTENKSETVVDGGTLADIPPVGEKPDANYKEGSWSPAAPTATTQITEDTTFTYTYAEKGTISHKVTFKVKNGKWDNGSKEDIAVTLTGREGDTLKLSADQIPAVGSKPDDGFKAGAWDTVPSTKTAITKDTTFTYDYIAEDAKIYTVTVTNDGHGTATASPTSGKSGKKVTLKAVSDAGYKFKKWKVVSGGVKLSDATKAKTTFKIKNANVKVKAIFEKIYEEPQPEIEPKGEDKIILAWFKVNEAKGYDIFMSRCNHGGKEITPKLIKTIKNKNTTQWTVTGLKPNKSYKAIIKAYTKDKNGKKKYISKSPLMHVYTAGGTKSYTNAKSVKLDTSDGKIKKGNKLTLNVKDTYKIKASVKKADKKKKLMPDSHVKTLRYRSSDPGVASVGASGKITAKKPGKCKIYVYAHNGVNKTINLTVK